MIGTCYDEDEEIERLKSNSISSITPGMCRNLKHSVMIRLIDARQIEASIRSYFTDGDNNLSFMLLQGIREISKKKCGCYILNLMLRFYIQTIKHTILSNKHKDMNLELTNLAVTILSLESLLEKCGVTCNPVKDPLLTRIEEYTRKHGDNAIYKTIGELEFLFDAIEKFV